MCRERCPVRMHVVYYLSETCNDDVSFATESWHPIPNFSFVVRVEVEFINKSLFVQKESD